MSIKKMLRRLINKGFTQKQIATAISVEQPTVSRLLRGAEPKYSLGKRIEHFYAEVNASR